MILTSGLMSAYRSSIGLAQRRERRRQKKEIVNPAKAISVSSGSPSAESRKSSKRKNRKRASKGEKDNVPSGMPFMHGFVAKNVGKQRLTVSYVFSFRQGLSLVPQPR